MSSPKTEAQETWDIDLDDVQWRIDQASKDNTRALYIPYWDARVVARKLDDLFGAAGWTDAYRTVVIDSKTGVECILTVKIDDEWISKSDVGVPSNFEAVKGAYSDAFKRAAAKLGVGRNVYDIAPIWAECGVFNNKPVKPKGIDGTLTARAKAAVAAGQRAGEVSDGPPPDNDAPTYEVDEKAWENFLGIVKGAPDEHKALVKEWWSTNGEGETVPRSVDAATFESLMAYVTAVVLNGEVVSAA
jgi:hypothetical protein